MLILISNENDQWLESPLSLASRDGHTDTVALLLKANADPNLQENNGCTPLYIASVNGHTDTVALLLKANANPNLEIKTMVAHLFMLLVRMVTLTQLPSS